MFYQNYPKITLASQIYEYLNGIMNTKPCFFNCNPQFKFVLEKPGNPAIPDSIQDAGGGNC
jgi:hypothetical protein